VEGAPLTGAREIRRPKTESRRKSEIRNPKRRLTGAFGPRVSAFGLVNLVPPERAHPQESEAPSPCFTHHQPPSGLRLVLYCKRHRMPLTLLHSLTASISSLFRPAQRARAHMFQVELVGEERPARATRPRESNRLGGRARYSLFTRKNCCGSEPGVMVNDPGVPALVLTRAQFVSQAVTLLVWSSTNFEPVPPE